MANSYGVGGITNAFTGTGPNKVFGDNTIDHAFVKQYTNNVYMSLADKGYKFKDAVMHDTSVGEEAVMVEVIGSTTAVQHTQRHGDTPEPTNIGHGKRWVQMKTFDTVELIDQEDKIKTLIDPTNPYAVRQGQAIGREMDIEIHRALTGTAQVTEFNATGGPNDKSPVVLPATQKIILPTDSLKVGTGTGGGGGLTVDKLLDARQKLMESDNMLEDEELCLIVSPANITQLLKTTKVTSSDYAAIKALVTGEIREFAGFKFIWWNSLPVFNRGNNGTQSGAALTKAAAIAARTTTSQNLVAFVKSGIQMNTWKQVKTDMDRLPTKRNSLQLLTTATFGAARIDEEKVVEIECLVNGA